MFKNVPLIGVGALFRCRHGDRRSTQLLLQISMQERGRPLVAVLGGRGEYEACE